MSAARNAKRMPVCHPSVCGSELSVFVLSSCLGWARWLLVEASEEVWVVWVVCWMEPGRGEGSLGVCVFVWCLCRLDSCRPGLAAMDVRGGSQVIRICRPVLDVCVCVCSSWGVCLWCCLCWMWPRAWLGVAFRAVRGRVVLVHCFSCCGRCKCMGCVFDVSLMMYLLSVSCVGLQTGTRTISRQLWRGGEGWRSVRAGVWCLRNGIMCLCVSVCAVEVKNDEWPMKELYVLEVKERWRSRWMWIWASVCLCVCVCDLLCTGMNSTFVVCWRVCVRIRTFEQCLCACSIWTTAIATEQGLHWLSSAYSDV